jgi:chemotaxis response regulator CheB
VLVVDDQDLVRSGFAMILDAQPDLAVVGEAGDGAAAVRAAVSLAPDVVLMDVRMPGMDGIAATSAICAQTSARVLVLTTFDLDEYVYAALRAGASGFLPPRCSSGTSSSRPACSPGTAGSGARCTSAAASRLTSPAASGRSGSTAASPAAALGGVHGLDPGDRNRPPFRHQILG